MTLGVKYAGFKILCFRTCGFDSHLEYKALTTMLGLFYLIAFRYNCSTFSRAQGVFRRKVRLDFMLGSCVKHRMFIFSPNVSQPYFSSKKVSISSNVTACSGLLGWDIEFIFL